MTRTSFSPAAGIVVVLALVPAAAGIAVDTSPAAAQREAERAAPTGCVRGEPEPLLAPSPARPAPVFTRTGDREALETFQIDPGTELIIRHFGCAHFALEFTFVTRTGPPRSPTAWLARAAGWLRGLPVAPNQRQFVDYIARRLDEASARGYVPGAPLPLSETATLAMQVHHGPSETRLVLLYDDAL